MEFGVRVRSGVRVSIKIWERGKNGFGEVGRTIMDMVKSSDFILSMVGKPGGVKQGKFMCESNFSLFLCISTRKYTPSLWRKVNLRQFQVPPSFPRTVF